jgi:hypothetical protein
MAFKRLLSLITPQDIEVRKANIHRNILRDLARMGGEVFGPIPAGAHHGDEDLLKDIGEFRHRIRQ